MVQIISKEKGQKEKKPSGDTVLPSFRIKLGKNPQLKYYGTPLYTATEGQPSQNYGGGGGVHWR